MAPSTSATGTATTTVTSEQVPNPTRIVLSSAPTEPPSHASGPITADRILRIFADVIDTSAITHAPARTTIVSTRDNRVDRVDAAVVPSTANSSVPTDTVFDGYDPEQIRLMAEDCIVLDENDIPLGSASKKDCHILANIEKGLLHRAFSVFLFDQQDRLLLQQRASEKITFPDMWTNTCCSHPLSIPGEMGSSFEDSVEGVKRAAQRKLEHELGIKPEQVPIDEFVFLTRIHYKAPCDDKWGEHEIDYILIIKPTTPVTLDVNANEVRDTTFVTQDQLRNMFADQSLKFTPWFKLICQSSLFEWWNVIEQHGLQPDRLNRHVKAIVSGTRHVPSEPSDGREEDTEFVHKFGKLLEGVRELKRM